MNVAKRWVVLALSLTVSGFALGTTSPVEAVHTFTTTTGNTPLAQARVHGEQITVDTLVVSHALTAFADDKDPGSRSMKLDLASVHLKSARATTDALADGAMAAVGSTAQVRAGVTRTLAVLTSELDATIACEQVKTPGCGSAQMITRQSQAGQAAGAAVAELIRAVDVDPAFVAAASTLIEQDLAVPGVTFLNAAEVRVQALALTPSRKTPLRTDAPTA